MFQASARPWANDRIIWIGCAWKGERALNEYTFVRDMDADTEFEKAGQMPQDSTEKPAKAQKKPPKKAATKKQAAETKPDMANTRVTRSRRQAVAEGPAGNAFPSPPKVQLLTHDNLTVLG